MRLLNISKPGLTSEINSGLNFTEYNIGHAFLCLTKSAGTATLTHALSGRLYLSQTGWLLLSVPNALIRGAFDALDEHGAELPPTPEGKLNAHISVMTADEVEKLGGPDKLSERGHSYSYTLGPVMVVEPKGWDDVSKCWFITVQSKDLESLRKSYGLTPRPNNNKHEFHITFAVRKKHVLRNNEVSKKANIISMLPALLPAAGVTVGAYHLNNWLNPPAKKKKPVVVPEEHQVVEEPKEADKKPLHKIIQINHTRISVIDGLDPPKHKGFDSMHREVNDILEKLINKFHEKHDCKEDKKAAHKRAFSFLKFLKSEAV